MSHEAGCITPRGVKLPAPLQGVLERKRLGGEGVRVAWQSGVGRGACSGWGSTPAVGWFKERGADRVGREGGAAGPGRNAAV